MTRHRVGSVGDFRLRKFRVFSIGHRSIGVVRTENGFYAIRNRCPHQGAEICGGAISGTMLPSRPQQYDFTEERLVVLCPWHRWEFDLATGASVEHVAKKRLVTYPVAVDGDDVFVDVRAKRGDRD